MHNYDKNLLSVVVFKNPNADKILCKTKTNEN